MSRNLTIPNKTLKNFHFYSIAIQRVIKLMKIICENTCILHFLLLSCTKLKNKIQLNNR